MDRRILAWAQAINMIDETEVEIRDVIERELVNYAGFDHLRIGDAMSAATRAMKRVKAIRTRAIKKAFRLLRDHGI